MRQALWIVAVAVALTACSPSEGADVATTAARGPNSADVATSLVPDPRSKAALEFAGHELDVLAATRQDAQAWAYYSARCQAAIGNLTQYAAVLDKFFRGRNPNYESASAVVNGSSGKVISVDSDPSAPPSASLPRTWTFIDGRWQFDNC
ncbi:hypothetical protein ACTJJE_13295 [Mycolicibacterium sp. 22603]|uniref:hypothetical protein n=1 Tax=Mycolicibacterium sp. 22603 TaxID=3453950 RepID=UPI003F8681F9